MKKLNELLKNKSKKKGSSIDLRPEGLKKWVVNLTEHKLTRDQEDVLKLFCSSTKEITYVRHCHWY